MQNYYNPVVQTNEGLFFNNYFEQQQKKMKFKKHCSSIGFNIAVIFLIMSIIIIPFMFFLVPESETNKGIQGFDYISFYLFNSLFSFLAFFVYEAIYAKAHKLDFNSLFPFKKVSLSKCFPLLIIGYAIFSVANYAANILNNNFSLFGISDNSLSTENISGGSPAEIILYLIAFSVVPAITEEFAFRGVILGSMKKYGDGFAIFTSSLLFGLMHGNLVQIPFAFIGGLALGYIRVYTKSMLPSMVLHFINNAIAVSLDVFIMFFDEGLVEFCYILFLLIITVAALIAAIYLSRKDKNILNFAEDKATDFTFGEKIKMFFGNAGMVTALVAVSATVILNSSI